MARRDELVLVVDRQQRLVRALVADRRRRPSGPSRARRTASRPGGPARPRTSSGSVSSCSCSEWKMPRAPSSLSTARSGRAMSPTNRRVARQHRPRLVAALGVDQRERGVLGPVAGRVQRAHAHAAERRAPSRRRTARGRSRAPAARWMWMRRAGRRGQPAVAGDVVGVVVGLEDVLDVHARGSARGAGTRRCRAAGRRRRRRRRPRRRSGSEAQPRSSCVICRNSISALGSLPAGDRVGQLGRAEAALDAGERRRRERPGEQRPRAG